MPNRNLNEDWEDYDNRKIRDRRDGAFFSCDEPWEVDYLVKVIKKYKPFISEVAIRQAIEACCGIVRAPRPRGEFVTCVLNRL